MKSFLFGLSEIGGQTSSSKVIKTENNTKTQEKTEHSYGEEKDEEEMNLKNLFLSFNYLIPYLTLFKLPVYLN